MRQDYERSLPLDEYVLDRFERANLHQFGEGSSVHHLCYLYGKVSIGINTWVGPLTLLDGSGGLQIGDHCSISAGVHIYTHDTVKKRLSQGKIASEKSPVKIGNFCYLGPQAILTRGIQIGDYSIVGAGSYVSKSVPAYSVVFGSPAALKGRVKFDSSGAPSIEWFPKIDLEKKITDLESRLQRLEVKVKSNEEI